MFMFFFSFIIGPLQMLISQSILNQFFSNFGFYIPGPILTNYKKPHQISTNNPTTSNIQISTNSNAYISVNSLSILVKFWILNLMTKHNKPYDTTPHLDPSIEGLYSSSQVYLTAYISLNFTQLNLIQLYQT